MSPDRPGAPERWWRRWRGTLLGRLLPPLAGVVVVLTGLVMGVGTTVMRQAVRERAEARALTLSVVEREALDRLVRAGEHRDLQRIMEQLGQNPDVAAIRLLRPDGEIRASSHAHEVGTRAEAHAAQEGERGDLLDSPAGGAVVHTVQPIRNAAECRPCHGGGPLVALLDLDVAVNPHVTGRIAFGTLSALLGALYLLAVVAITIPTLGAVAVRPMKRLVSAMRRVQAGDLDVQVAPAGTLEVDALVDGFNEMVARLRQARAAEAEAQRLQMERVEQLAAVGELAAGLAHEVRNPLSGVKAVVEVLAQETALDETRRAILRDAAGELSRMDRIIRELLQYARPKPPSLAPFDLNEVVRDAVALTLAPALGDGATVDSRLDPELPPVLGDAAMVRQVLVNLLLNAQQAVPPGAPGTYLVATGASDGMAWCRIRDFGPGVPADRAETIFRPFVTTKTRGTGLGLAISRRLVEVQGGRLTLDNPGQTGASFTFTIPLAPPDPSPCRHDDEPDPDRGR
jgi:signal transduction histidine kinase